ncbi:MAG: lysophospholipid acyltransferase family protein [Opitutales bacterium]
MTPIYRKCRDLVAWYFDNLHEFTVSGLENIPEEGGLILAANHVSFYDPPAIGAVFPRQIHYFARDTLFRGPFGRLLENLEVIPVAREHADVKSLKSIFRALQREGVVAIYPEGTRSYDGKPMSPKPGAGMIACKTGATVVPTRIFGTYETFGRHCMLPRPGQPIHVSYGSPLHRDNIDPGKEHPERYLEASRRIMARIVALEPPQPTVV